MSVLYPSQIGFSDQDEVLSGYTNVPVTFLSSARIIELYGFETFGSGNSDHIFGGTTISVTIVNPQAGDRLFINPALSGGLVSKMANGNYQATGTYNFAMATVSDNTQISLTGGAYPSPNGIELDALDALLHSIEYANTSNSLPSSVEIALTFPASDDRVLQPSTQYITLNLASPPSVVNESATILANGAVSGTAGVTGTGALAGDSDVLGYALSVSAIAGGSIGAATHGQFGDLTLNADGSYVYTAGATSAELASIAAATGTVDDSFSYSVSDGHGGASSATLDVKFDASKPSVSAIVFSFPAGFLTSANPAKITLTLSDGFAIDTAGGAPTLTLNDGSTATYDAAASSTGTAVFHYLRGNTGSQTPANLVSRLNLNGAVIRNSAGVAVASSLSVAGASQVDPQSLASGPYALLDNGSSVLSGYTNTPIALFPNGVVFNAQESLANEFLTATITIVNPTPGDKILLNPAYVGSNHTGPIYRGAGLNPLIYVSNDTYGSLHNNNNIYPLTGPFANAGDSFAIESNFPMEGVTTFFDALEYQNFSNAPPASAQVAISWSYAGSTSIPLPPTQYITINGVPLPNLVHDTGTIVANATVSGTAGVSGTGALAGDSDANGYGLSVSGVVGGSLGAAVNGQYGDFTLNADGSYTYVAGANASERAAIAAANGPLDDPFSYSVSDGHGGVLAATLDIHLDATRPTVASIAFTFPAADLAAGAAGQITLTLADAGAIDTSGGAPTLTLNNGATATYDAAASSQGSLVFDYTVAPTDTNVAALAVSSVNLNGAVIANASGVAHAATLSVAGVAQSGPQIDTTIPAVTSITESSPSQVAALGAKVVLTLALNDAVTVTGRAPTLTLNDGGVASYNAAESTATSLAFDYTVSQSDHHVSSLAASLFNLGGAAIVNGAGTALSTSLSGLTQSGPDVEVGPTISAVIASPSSGVFGPGKTISLLVEMDKPVVVTGTTATLSLNDGGVATLDAAATAALQAFGLLEFSYTTSSADQSVAALAVESLNLNGSTVSDAFGNAASLPPSVATLANVVIETTPPTLSPVADQTVSATSASGAVVDFSATANDPIDGVLAVAFAENGQAVHSGDLFAIGQHTLVASAVDKAGNAASETFHINVEAAPAVIGVAANPGAGDVNDGGFVAITVSLSQNVTVTGTPQLALNDGGVASYVSGSGGSALTFVAPVGAGQNAATLAIMGYAANGGAIVSAASGLAADLSAADVSFPGLSVGATVNSVVATPSAPHLGPGAKVTFTVGFSETVRVSGGTPYLALNNGGRAIYASGSGSNALTFRYTVGPTGSGQSTSALAVTGFVANGAAVYDSNIVGDSADLSGVAAYATGLSVDTTAPTVSGVVAAGAGLDGSGNGEIGAGVDLTLSVSFSEAVILTGANAPTLKLSNGATATYTGGSGSNTLTFDYVTATGQNTADLAVKSIALNGDALKDGAGNSANLKGAVGALGGLVQIDAGPAVVVLTNGQTRTTTYNLDGSIHDVDYANVTGQAYTEYDVLYGANGKPASANYSNGMTAVWTYGSSGVLQQIFYQNAGGIIGATQQNNYDSSGALTTVITRSAGGAESIVGHAAGLTIIADDASDRITGNGAGDTFVFGATIGHDVVTDFAATLGSTKPDTISLPGQTFGYSFDTLRQHTSFASAGATIAFAPNESLLLSGLTQSQMLSHQGAFMFHA